MSAPLAPGVYVETVSSGIRPITGASTSIPAFLGTVPPPDLFIGKGTWPSEEKESFYQAHKFYSWAEFASYCCVDKALKWLAVVNPYLAQENNRWPKDINGTTDISVNPPADPTDRKTLETQRDNFREFLVLAEAVYGFFANGGGECYVIPLALGNVANRKVPKPTLTGFKKELLKTLPLMETLPVSMVAVPELAYMAAQNVESGSGRKVDTQLHTQIEQCVQGIVKICHATGNRVAILDTPNGKDLPVREAESLPNFGLSEPEQEFAALYYPWVTVPGLDDLARTVPPCGHIAGVWARTDDQRGVHKAPANEALQGVQALPVQVSDVLQAGLNSKHVNCLRTFPGRGIRVWGARTLATESRDFRYLNVRRLTCFLVDSIRSQTGWAVFEPNDETLRLTLRQTITSFLTDQWHHGALQGTTAAEAFYVICDKSNNPQTTIDKGEVHCDIGIAPVRPAEFVHFTIKQTAGAAG